MAKQIPATTKNSPPIHHGANRDNLPAEAYEIPHTMDGKKVDIRDDVGLELKMPTRKNWTPLNGGVSIGHDAEVKTTGIKLRGTGAAIKGIISRGPMA
jgi:hypothetical protein